MSEGKKEDEAQEETNVLSFDEEKERLRQEIEQGIFSRKAKLNEDIKDSDEEGLLKFMNEKYAFINSVGGKPMIMCHVYSNTEKRKVIEFRSPEAISIQHSNQSVKVGQAYIELGRWWIKHSARREYDSIIFDPNLPKEYNKCYNIYQGLNLTPAQGSWKRTLRHIYTVLCNSDRDKFNYTIKWIAWCLQNPGTRAEIVMIFKGKEGAGKGFIFSQLVHIFGRHGLHVSNRGHLTGNFNGHLADCVFLFADEAYYPGDKEVEGALNQLISEDKIAIERKGRDLTVQKNCLHIGMATNADWVIPASGEARRYYINEVDNRWAKGSTTDRKREIYFKALWDEMDNGGREAMCHDLMKIDLKDWHPRFNVPLTEELKHQASISVSGINKVIAGFLEQGEFPGNANREYEEFTATVAGLDSFIYKNINSGYNRTSPKMKSIIYKKIGGIRRHVREGSLWIFPSLKKCKENFIANIQKNYKFECMEDEWSTGRTEY